MIFLTKKSILIWYITNSCLKLKNCKLFLRNTLVLLGTKILKDFFSDCKKFINWQDFGYVAF